MVRSRGLTSGALKVIGLLLVLASAAGTAVWGRGLPADLATASMLALTRVVLCEAVSWVGFPIYAWLLYTGYRHTHDVVRYGLRLAALAVVSEVPYDLVTSGRAWDIHSQNPVFALLIALVVLCALDRFRQAYRGGFVLLGALVVVAGAIWVLVFSVGLRLSIMPGGLVIYLFVLIFYWLDGRDNVLAIVGALVGAIALVVPAMGMVVLHFRNDEQGLARPGKYVFYVAYPVCLLAVWLIGLAR
ncbi:MAG: conjugal transfer protein TraX [Propionibacteriaceae bacterium]|nr:conjugal transfer protein TraX [Propionibacteriaceae bacterium]